MLVYLRGHAGGQRKVEKYLNTIEATVTAHTYYETVTFRSRMWYAGQVRMEKVKPIPHTDGRKSCPEMFREVRIKMKSEESMCLEPNRPNTVLGLFSLYFWFLLNSVRRYTGNADITI